MLSFLNEVFNALKGHMDILIDFLHSFFQGNLISISWESKRSESTKREIKASNRAVLLILAIIGAALLIARHYGV